MAACMTDASHSSSPVIPYRKGVMPANTQYPFPDPVFTNPDPRLRPQSSIGSQNGTYFRYDSHLPVTQYNFPELFKVIAATLKRSGMEEYSLYIIKDYVPRAGVDFDGRRIYISLDQLNANDFSSIQFLVDHELGHAWQNKYPGAPHVTIRSETLKQNYRYEMEADIFAYCLSGDREAIIRGLRHMGNYDDGITHPSTKRREDAIKAANPLDCVTFNLNTLPKHKKLPVIATK